MKYCCEKRLGTDKQLGARKTPCSSLLLTLITSLATSWTISNIQAIDRIVHLWIRYQLMHLPCGFIEGIASYVEYSKWILLFDTEGVHGVQHTNRTKTIKTSLSSCCSVMISLHPVLSCSGGLSCHVVVDTILLWPDFRWIIMHNLPTSYSTVKATSLWYLWSKDNDHTSYATVQTVLPDIESYKAPCCSTRFWNGVLSPHSHAIAK